ncbi:MAG: hypothetical protein SO170_07905 [Butyribacter sp.]|nr:hypothetical protein [bacterium]MDY3854860.1 hypothetical protein [Butyribacter sp.]
MGTGDFIILGILFLLVVAAVIHLCRHKSACGCAGCSGCRNKCYVSRQGRDGEEPEVR